MDQTLDSNQDSTQERTFWGQFLKRTLKPILIVIVILGIGQSIRLAWQDLRATQSRVYIRIIELQQRLTNASPVERTVIEAEIAAIEQHQFSIQNIRWDIASWSIAVSFAALLPPAIYWWITLGCFEHTVPFVSTLAIYSAGNLGKYVPGKAMVLVLRSGAMNRLGVPISTSIVSIFVETLTSLSVGGAIGAVTLASLDPPEWLFQIAIGAAIVSLVPTIPPVFKRLLVILTRYRHLRLPGQLAHAMKWRLVASGWFLFVCSWLLMGTSLWFICEAIRQSMAVDPSGVTNISVSALRLWWVCIAASCLGFVIGFLSMLPGGAGVREVVVTMLLARPCDGGPSHAVGARAALQAALTS